jgi:hypothetical protein
MNRYEIALMDKSTGKPRIVNYEAETAADALFIAEFETNDCLVSGKDCKFYLSEKVIGIRAVEKI